MSNEFPMTPSGYHYRLETPFEPIDPPDNAGGGLAGDPIESDYIELPESVDLPDIDQLPEK